jgi:hypothetical protein
MDAQSPLAGAGIWPISFAIGIAVLLVGLIVSPQVIAPLGDAITLFAGTAWVRGNRRTPRTETAPAARERRDETNEQRFPRSRFLERATLALGGLVALGAGLPAAGFAILPSVLGQRRRPVDLVPAQPSGFGCPCHGSQFDNEGNRTAGPAPRALDRYQFSIRNGRLWLGRLYSVSRVDGTGAQARIHSFALKGDGEPATGLEAWLYPIDPPS